MKYETPEECWEYFWRDICTYADGASLDMDQVKAELFDFYQAMHNVSKVYDNITGGRISKILTDPDVVYDVAYNYFEDIFTEDE